MKTKHTPASCDCHIIKRNGEPLTTADYDKDSPNAPSRIEQCPLHADAPDLLAALEGMMAWARRVKGPNPGPEILNACNAIAKAEGSL